MKKPLRAFVEIEMNDDQVTIAVMRDHMVWLNNVLEKERQQARLKTILLKRMLDPDDLGHAVSEEVRKIAYQIISNEALKGRYIDQGDSDV
jgi:hypothetical protein